MRNRFDRILASAVIYSLSLVALLPHNLAYASMWRRLASAEGFRPSEYYLMRIGFACLALILVGLIVVWTGYLRREPWSWATVMVITWVFAFPAYVLPILVRAYHAREPLDWLGWLRAALASPGPDRETAKGALDFLLMVVALLLSLKPFWAAFRGPRGAQPVPTRPPSDAHKPGESW